MSESILLNSLLNFIYSEDKENNSVEDVSCSCEGGLKVICSNSDNVTYRTSIVLKDDIVLGSDKSTVVYCKDSYKSYLKRTEKEMLIVKEGVDRETNKTVFISVKATNCNVDVLLLELTRDYDKYSEFLGRGRVKISTFVYDTYDNTISMYPLKADIDGTTEEVVIKVSKGNIDCSDFYKKVPRLKGRFDEGLLKCIGYFLGDYKISVDVLKDTKICIPVMYFLFLEDIMSSMEMC